MSDIFRARFKLIEKYKWIQSVKKSFTFDADMACHKILFPEYTYSALH